MQNPYLKNRRKVVLEARKEPLVKQSFKDQCDIHNIIGQYNKTGLVTHLNESPQLEIDHTLLPDFQSALNSSVYVGQQFDQLPDNIRDRFKTTKHLLDFISNPSNTAEAQKLGLLPQPQPSDAPQKAGEEGSAGASV